MSGYTIKELENAQYFLEFSKKKIKKLSEEIYYYHKGFILSTEEKKYFEDNIWDEIPENKKWLPIEIQKKVRISNTIKRILDLTDLDTSRISMQEVRNKERTEYQDLENILHEGFNEAISPKEFYTKMDCGYYAKTIPLLEKGIDYLLKLEGIEYKDVPQYLKNLENKGLIDNVKDKRVLSSFRAVVDALNSEENIVISKELLKQFKKKDGSIIPNGTIKDLYDHIVLKEKKSL
ncbi:MAG: hypothetical protein LKF96_11415 [Treponema sp.]|jgi:polyhydroxyalkanoate synthesis regulator phasin|nr:hypothetical protein [Treponema sp.]